MAEGVAPCGLWLAICDSRAGSSGFRLYCPLGPALGKCSEARLGNVYEHYANQDPNEKPALAGFSFPVQSIAAESTTWIGIKSAASVDPHTPHRC